MSVSPDSPDLACVLVQRARELMDEIVDARATADLLRARASDSPLPDPIMAEVRRVWFNGKHYRCGIVVAQKEAALEEIRRALSMVGVPVTRADPDGPDHVGKVTLCPHSELPGHSSSRCPGCLPSHDGPCIVFFCTRGP